MKVRKTARLERRVRELESEVEELMDQFDSRLRLIEAYHDLEITRGYGNAPSPVNGRKGMLESLRFHGAGNDLGNI